MIVLALTIGVLVAGAAYLVLQREMVRIALGFLLLSHAVNLMIITAGGPERRGEALGSILDPASTADPLPAAFVLTAIVIAFAITIYLLVLAVAGREGDDVTDDLVDEPVDPPGPDPTPEEVRDARTER
ncbi:sodium:proton antiporter [Nocardioides massiliensis]|uniref:Multicomponent Na+:H+ antiporter subunit C n=1 Tax=Nocardioides massiliensis TaxID=1325935 RepID=A0ABT9NKP5_9ACTN|nr:cation:proton antiporter subunit C [Nocardioides massiliensis]MDP9820968.1 multicomponent Na+:H+ antiporter subunit C [Nocardioides massiliensis]